MTGEAHRRRRAREDGRQLFTEQHEDDAIGGELDDIPHRVAANARRGGKFAAPLDEAHRKACGHRGQDARTAPCETSLAPLRGSCLDHVSTIYLQRL